MICQGWVLVCSNYCQETWKQKQKIKINQQTILKNSRKIKAMRNETPTMDHYPRNGYMGNTNP